MKLTWAMGHTNSYCETIFYCCRNFAWWHEAVLRWREHHFAPVDSSRKTSIQWLLQENKGHISSLRKQANKKFKKTTTNTNKKKDKTPLPPPKKKAKKTKMVEHFPKLGGGGMTSDLKWEGGGSGFEETLLLVSLYFSLEINYVYYQLRCRALQQWVTK